MKLLALFVTCAFWLAAADPAGFALWKSADLKGMEKKLSPKIDQKKVALEPLANWGNHLISMAHREGSGEAELHETQADIFIVESGKATLVVGGTIIDPKTTAPHEIRGSSIKDGERRQLGPGDVLHIAAKTPHQMILEPGAQITYAFVKVNVE
jgi:mannose-6-phosphate isomerase-like protein (cupin superfamily)